MRTIRPASLEDVPAIVAIHRADIVTWRAWDGTPGDAGRLARYEDLSPYQRWLNGGVWLDESIYAPYLARLLAPGSGGVALVAEAAGEVRAVAEAHASEEPPPYGRYLNVSVLYTRRGHAHQGLGSALLTALHQHAEQAGCQRMMVAHAQAPGFYARHGFQRAETWRRARLPARAGSTQYSAAPLAPGDYGMVRGWAMPTGRHQSAREEWERIRPGGEPDFAEREGLRRERWRLEVRRGTAMLALDEVPRARGAANVHLWLPAERGAEGNPPRIPAISRQLLAAIRDRAARSGLAELLFFVAETTLPQLGRGWEDDGYRQEVWMKAV